MCWKQAAGPDFRLDMPAGTDHNRANRLGGGKMPETQSEFDIRTLKFKLQNLEHEAETALFAMREQMAALNERVAALEQRAAADDPGPLKPGKRAKTEPNSDAEPEFEGL